jgi:hypothetical protein
MRALSREKERERGRLAPLRDGRSAKDFQFSDIDLDEVDRLDVSEKVKAYETFLHAQIEENKQYKRLKSKEVLREERRQYRVQARRLTDGNTKHSREFLRSVARGEYFGKQDLMLEPDPRNVFHQKTKNEVQQRKAESPVSNPWKSSRRLGALLENPAVYSQLQVQGAANTTALLGKTGYHTSKQMIMNDEFTRRLRERAAQTAKKNLEMELARGKSPNGVDGGEIGKERWETFSRPRERFSKPVTDMADPKTHWPVDEKLRTRLPLFNSTTKKVGGLFGYVHCPRTRHPTPVPMLEETSSTPMETQGNANAYQTQRSMGMFK